jgi:hypothetical protein
VNAKQFIALLALALLLCVGGCSINGGIESPVAEVVSAKVVQQTGDGVRVEVTVLLTQSNKVPLPLPKASADITVGNNGSREIKDDPHRTLPVGGDQGTGKQLVVLPIAFPASAGVAPGASYNISGSITFEPPGEVRRVLTESGVPLPTAGFSKSGRLD